ITKEAFRSAVLRCVLTAIPQWEAGLVISRPYGGFYYGRPPAQPETGPNVKVKRILELVELSFTIGDLSPCTALFTTLLQIPPNMKITDRFTELHTPLIPLLKDALTRHGKTM